MINYSPWLINAIIFFLSIDSTYIYINILDYILLWSDCAIKSFITEISIYFSYWF